MQSQSLSGSWELRQAGKEQTYPAQVPGGVHTDLLAAGCIPDPFVADNELKVQWVAEQDWVFRRTFRVTEQLLNEDRVFLVCDGLDTLGKIELNGQKVASFKNMFVQYVLDVKNQLQAGENEIVITFELGCEVCFRSPECPSVNRRWAGDSRWAARPQGSQPVWLGLGSDDPSDWDLEGYSPGRIQHRAD